MHTHPADRPTACDLPDGTLCDETPALRLVDALASCNGCDFEDALDNPMGYGPKCLAESRETIRGAMLDFDVATLDRDSAIARIRAALRTRTGRSWSVRGGQGTVWGWIDIKSMPAAYRANGYSLTVDEQKILADALGLDGVSHQGVSIPAGTDYRIEYVDRAEGREPRRIGTPYWD